MKHLKTVGRLISTSALAGLLALGAETSARAQQAVAGGTPGWSGYAPGYAWGNTAPSVGGFAPQTSAPVYVYPPGTGWQGYAPGTAWQGYRPSTAWQGYTPGVQGAVRSAPAPRSAISSRNREYGSGRNVHMHKPWLPSAPR
ncbi:hypothetical protein [Planctomyces sp. SH-PL62]|uniref:hypothetical protein n=1 Tax=Planctomyces sp. SH-PL62 TaxID=1636152 RepID=UPI00078CB667|nr:hypothetical protein [Planctomyces sp. SH-PL62]AMV36213.1 hypothetical protein VT85_02135 [Planctomyces sp. SH-PL62]